MKIAMKNLEPGTLGSLKVGSQVLVQGLDMRCKGVLTSMTLIKNGKKSVLRGKDGISVCVDGEDNDFFIDLPSVRKRLEQRIV